MITILITVVNAAVIRLLGSDFQVFARTRVDGPEARRDAAGTRTRS